MNNDEIQRLKDALLQFVEDTTNGKNIAATDGQYAAMVEAANILVNLA